MAKLRTKKDLEKVRINIEKTLNNLTLRLDNIYNHKEIEPALLDRRGEPVQRRLNTKKKNVPCMAFMFPSRLY